MHKAILRNRKLDILRRSMSSHRGKIDATCNSLFKKRTADVVSYGDQLAVRSKYFKALHVGDQGGEIHLMRYHWINP